MLIESDDSKLFWSAQILNIIAILSAGLPHWATALIATLGILLTIVSLINQLATLWDKSKTWYIIVVVKERIFKKKSK